MQKLLKLMQASQREQRALMETVSALAQTRTGTASVKSDFGAWFSSSSLSIHDSLWKDFEKEIFIMLCGYLDKSNSIRMWEQQQQQVTGQQQQQMEGL